MANLFKMELYRLLKQKSWWVLLLVVSAFTFLTSFSIVGINNMLYAEFPSEFLFTDIFLMLLSVSLSVLLPLTLLGISLFLHNMRSGGFHKNVIGVIGDYKKIIYVDYIIAFCYSLVFLLVVSLITTIVALFNKGINGVGNVGDILLTLSLSAVVLAGQVSVLMLVYSLFREKNIALTIVYIFLGSTVLSLIFNISDSIVLSIVNSGKTEYVNVAFKFAYLNNSANFSLMPVLVNSTNNDLISGQNTRILQTNLILVVAVFQIVTGLLLTPIRYQRVDQA